MFSKDILSKKYREFSEAEGNQNISSQFAILKICNIINSFGINTVLELGLGIGSICGSVLSANRSENEINYDGTETNEFCLGSLRINLESDFKHLRIYESLFSIPKVRRYGLIIIDGKDQNLAKIEEIISVTGIIAIEGDRTPQQEILQHLFPRHKYVHCISLKRNKQYSPFSTEDWQGGLKVIFINPTTKQYIWWYKEKIKTKLKYQYPGRFFGDKN